MYNFCLIVTGYQTAFDNRFDLMEIKKKYFEYKYFIQLTFCCL